MGDKFEVWIRPSTNLVSACKCDRKRERTRIQTIGCSAQVGQKIGGQVGRRVVDISI